MGKFYEEKETVTQLDSEGNVLRQTEKTKTRTAKGGEPDYIKLYTNMWCEFNGIPVAYRSLFLELVMRMSYCNARNLGKSQIVYTSKPNGDSICEALGWKSRQSLQKGLKVLCECGAIKWVNKGVYQINPAYAGRGQWRYNASADQGGIENLIATFNFKEKAVETNMVWAEDENEDEVHQMITGGSEEDVED